MTLKDYGIFTAFGPIGYGMKNQMDQAAIQKKQAAFAQAQKNRQAIAQARMAMGKSVNAAANQGASDTSGAQGGMASISSQLASNLDSIFSTGAYQQKMAGAKMWGDLNEGINIMGQKAGSAVMAMV